MKKLLKYLSPFAPDQSGACGVLYELGGLIVICDAGGCAGNICGFDEPRWFTKRSAVFSAGLRDMDAIMGRDDKLIEKLAKAQESINGKFTAIVGTPVPAVIATDMKALKRMAEKRLGVPCITVYCDGTKYYDAGEEATWLSLFTEYSEKPDSDKTTPALDNIAPASDKVGIIGATPLETGYSNEKLLNNMCHSYGIENPVIYSIGTTLEDVKQAYSVSKNLVVSVAGLKAAEYLKETYGTPYEVGYPFISEEIKQNAVTAVSATKDMETSKVLIIHSQFAANELRTIIRNELKNFDQNKITINNATWFMQDSRFTEDGDFRLTNEDELWDIAQSGKYDVIIADGDIEKLLDAAGFNGSFVEYPHFAISGKMFDDGVTLYNDAE